MTHDCGFFVDFEFHLSGYIHCFAITSAALVGKHILLLINSSQGQWMHYN